MGAASVRLTTADRALLRARIGWGRAAEDRFRARLSPDWRDRLEKAREAGSAGPIAPEEARSALRSEHAAEALPDPMRIHPSWWVRALQDESPAVRRAVAAHAPASIREALRSGLSLGPEDLRVDRPAHPDALRWALALWGERLVGGPEAGPDDPPIVAALTLPDRRARFRLIALMGLAKLALVAAGSSAPEAGPGVVEGLGEDDRARLDHFRAAWGQGDPQFVGVARLDWEDSARADGGQALHRLGLVTAGRLLSVAEPFRARWTLQHLPYGVAKYIRTFMGPKYPLAPGADLLDCESRVLHLACDRLRDEGIVDGDGGGVA